MLKESSTKIKEYFQEYFNDKMTAENDVSKNMNVLLCTNRSIGSVLLLKICKIARSRINYWEDGDVWINIYHYCGILCTSLSLNEKSIARYSDDTLKKYQPIDYIETAKKSINGILEKVSDITNNRTISSMANKLFLWEQTFKKQVEMIQSIVVENGLQVFTKPCFQVMGNEKKSPIQNLNIALTKELLEEAEGRIRFWKSFLKNRDTFDGLHVLLGILNTHQRKLKKVCQQLKPKKLFTLRDLKKFLKDVYDELNSIETETSLFYSQYKDSLTNSIWYLEGLNLDWVSWISFVIEPLGLVMEELTETMNCAIIEKIKNEPLPDALQLPDASNLIYNLDTFILLRLKVSKIRQTMEIALNYKCNSSSPHNIASLEESTSKYSSNHFRVKLGRLITSLKSHTHLVANWQCIATRVETMILLDYANENYLPEILQNAIKESCKAIEYFQELMIIADKKSLEISDEYLKGKDSLINYLEITVWLYKYLETSRVKANNDLDKWLEEPKMKKRTKRKTTPKSKKTLSPSIVENREDSLSSNQQVDAVPLKPFKKESQDKNLESKDQEISSLEEEDNKDSQNSIKEDKDKQIQLLESFKEKVESIPLNVEPTALAILSL